MKRKLNFLSIFALMAMAFAFILVSCQKDEIKDGKLLMTSDDCITDISDVITVPADAVVTDHGIINMKPQTGPDCTYSYKLDKKVPRDALAVIDAPEGFTGEITFKVSGDKVNGYYIEISDNIVGYTAVIDAAYFKGARDTYRKLTFEPGVTYAGPLPAPKNAAGGAADISHTWFCYSLTLGNTFTDARDGNVYKMVTIGDQIWMAENLRYLPSVAGPATGSPTTPYYYVYDYNGTNVTTAKASAFYATYGVLYNWPAAMAGSVSSTANPSGVQGVCPAGWHLPSDAEWTELTDYLGGTSVAGGKLKETGTTNWNSPNEGATNETGFTALPGGLVSYGMDYSFRDIGYRGNWWSATEDDSKDAWGRGMRYNDSVVGWGYDYKYHGASVRCLRD